jgi:hypothetical protein
MLGQPECLRRGHDPLAGANEKIRLQLVGEAMDLNADRPRRKIDLLRRPRHSRRFHDCQKQLELTDIHNAAPPAPCFVVGQAILPANPAP